MPTGVYIRTEKEKQRLQNFSKKYGFQKGHRSTPWNKDKKGSQVAWNKGIKGYLAGEKNGMWKGGHSHNNYLERKERKAGRKKPGVCEICKYPGIICFDHNHKTGKFRGWICKRCNLIIGMAQDDRELLLKLIEYLENDNLQENNSVPKDTEDEEQD